MSTENDLDLKAVAPSVQAVAERAQAAARTFGNTPRSVKDAVLLAIADALCAATDMIVAANAIDVARERSAGMTDSLVDRLRLDAERIAGIAHSVKKVAALPDPVGEIVRGSTLPQGIRLRQVRVPMGVVAMIYEARPNVTVDAAVLSIKSGNAVILRGGSAARSSNEAIIDVIQKTLKEANLPGDLVQSIDAYGRAGGQVLMKLRGLVDVLVPRGGAGLIRSVVENSTVPVIETGTGNCHVFVDDSADLSQALAIVMNAKVQRPSVCNAAETLLVHEDVAERFLPVVLAELREAQIILHLDTRAQEIVGTSFGLLATEEDWAKEYLDLELAVRVVPSIDEAIAHIQRWSTGHTEAIVTSNVRAADRFTASVDSAVVAVNASTRFTDGAEFGLGAEVGVSTQKLHARGPMGLADLTTTKWIVNGDGHVRD